MSQSLQDDAAVDIDAVNINSVKIDTDDWPALLASAKAGDREALGEMIQRLRGYLWLITNAGMTAGLRRKCAASDIVQQSFIEVQQGFESFDGEEESDLRRWLVKIVKNNLTDAGRHYRKQKRDTGREVGIDPSWDVSGGDRTPSSVLCLKEDGMHLMQAIAKLPDRQRAIVVMRHRQELSYEEISRQMKITEIAARKLWSRSLVQLRKLLDPSSHDPTSHDLQPQQPR